MELQAADGAMVTHSPLTATMGVPLCATHGMSFTLHNQCLMVFSWGFSSTVRRARNCSNSDWDYLKSPRLAWLDVALKDIKMG